MGFGLLFIGYFITFILSLTKYGYVISLAGYALMSYALIKLRDYELKFTWPMGTGFALIVTGILKCIFGFSSEFRWTLPGWLSACETAVSWVEFVLLLVFNLALLWAIRALAGKLELPRQMNAAGRNAVCVSVYFVLNFLGIGPLAGNEGYVKYFGLPTILIRLLWIILNLVLIFSCYMYMCPAGDEEMPRKKTNIKFIDNILEESDRRLDKATKETTDYYTERKKNRMNNRKKK